MLQALLHDKLTRYFTKSPYEVEDLLTSVVIGSCAYVPHDLAVLPFLGEARDANGTKLGEVLRDVEHVAYDFWPNWSSIGGARPTEPNSSDASDAEALPDAAGHDVEPELGARGAQPEILLTVTRRAQPPALVLVEAKLLSQKSSRSTETGAVNDQLGRYWLHLRDRANRQGAEAVAIVYVTAGLRRPPMDFEETQKELKLKGAPAAPLFWLSWCHFAAVVRQQHSAPILADVLSLLVNTWGLSATMGEWPETPVLVGAHWRFPVSWRWPQVAVDCPAWQFKTRS